MCFGSKLHKPFLPSFPKKQIGEERALVALHSHKVGERRDWKGCGSGCCILFSPWDSSLWWFLISWCLRHVFSGEKNLDFVLGTLSLKDKKKCFVVNPKSSCVFLITVSVLVPERILSYKNGLNFLIVLISVSRTLPLCWGFLTVCSEWHQRSQELSWLLRCQPPRWNPFIMFLVQQTSVCSQCRPWEAAVVTWRI